MLPLVSILFPCYNAEKYLAFSLKSILNQDYKNLQVICINDGSKDNTLNILKSEQSKDERIVIINNEVNLGLIDSLNKSFDFIKGDFFARMDADDFSPPNRISLQVEFLLKNSQYDLVSSAYSYFRENGGRLKYVPPLGKLQNSLKFISLFSTPLAHGSVMGKTSLIRNGQYFYDKKFSHAEDFELFSRLCWQNVPMTNMSDSLYWARLNSTSVSAVFNEAQIKTNQKIIGRNLNEYLGIEETINEKILKIISSRIDVKISRLELNTALSLLNSFYQVTETKMSFSREEKMEIKNYLNLQKLNIIIQSNKMLFKSSKLQNIPFFIFSLSLLKFQQLGLIIKKLQGYLQGKTQTFNHLQ